jgi:hypothetical protein
MHCERAQEFFSDYLERSLDRPLTVALEGHLAGCAGCRNDIEALRDTFLALSSAPLVEPPPDGAWQVLCRLQAARAAQLEAQRQRAPGLLAWLQGLNPMGVAMGAGLATLVFAGTLVVTGIPHIQNSFAPPGRKAAPSPLAVPGGPPAVTLTYGAPSAAGQPTLNLRLAPSIDLPDARVLVSGSQDWEVPPGRINRGTVLEIPLSVPAQTRVEVMRVTVESQALDRRYRYLIAAPVAERRDGPATLTLPEQPLESVLRQVAPFLDVPVVVDGALEAPAGLTADRWPAERCLEELAAQLGGEVRREQGVYRIAPR